MNLTIARTSACNIPYASVLRAGSAILPRRHGFFVIAGAIDICGDFSPLPQCQNGREVCPGAKKMQAACQNDAVT
jgi:hypothetical protein